MAGVKEAKIEIAGLEVRVAVAHQMGNARHVVDAIREDLAAGREPRWHFIEIMACRGGCIGGGGQPYGATDAIRKKRIAGLYKDDKQAIYRCSHENPQVQELYDEFLGKPLSEKSHQYLHTRYTARPLYTR